MEESIVADKRIAPYGSWKSPITSDMIVAGQVRISEARLDGASVYWLEARPAEAGRCVIVQRDPDGTTRDRVPDPYNVRTRVHEYGGGAYDVADGTLYFSNFADNRLYTQQAISQPVPLTPESSYRYADLEIDRGRNRLLCVREDHSNPDREAVNTLVAIDLTDGSNQSVLVSGNDFYSSPRLSPEGDRLAWLTWCHPNMPWDGTELWVGDVEQDGTVANPRQVAGGKSESIFQPEWSPNGVLYFTSDRTEWWNLYRLSDGGPEPVTEVEGEIGVPHWVFGLSRYAFLSDNSLLCAIQQQGRTNLAVVDLQSCAITPIESRYTNIGSVRASRDNAIFVGCSPHEESKVVRVDIGTGAQEVVGQAGSLHIAEGYISTAEPIEFPTENGLTAHAFFYPPANQDYAAPPDERPPLIVHSHGGPTGAASDCYDPSIQFWTSRGFALVDVNYGGSTGYGRAYRQRLNGQWGIVDVDDCVNAARDLVKQGRVDPERLIIVGGSAGGYTTLCALTFRDAFKAGASYFGIGDLTPFVTDTHKFESRYLDTLIGPYPECRQLYYERSAINFTDQLSCPVIIFQGLEDKVVPPNQAELMVEALRAKKLPFAYVPFEGEGHGFRRAENIKRTLDAELYFYSRIFDFDLPDPVEPVTIENL
jgi:dipeptidyl aminopeptidase/acylaminoacyl peptidase